MLGRNPSRLFGALKKIKDARDDTRQSPEAERPKATPQRQSALPSRPKVKVPASLAALPHVKVAAIELATTDSNKGEILAVAIVDMDGQTLFSSAFKPIATAWRSHAWDYGMTAESLANLSPFKESKERLAEILADLDVVLAYEFWNVLGNLRHAGVFVEASVVNVKSAIIDHIGYATDTASMTGGKLHSSFQEGDTPLKTARALFEVFAGLPMDVQRRALGKAQQSLEKRRAEQALREERQRRSSILAEATPEPHMETPDVPEGQEPFGRREYLCTVDMSLDTDGKPYEVARHYHADEVTLAKVIEDVRPILAQLPDSGEYMPSLEPDLSSATMQVASLTKGGKRRKYPIIVDFEVLDSKEDEIFDYDDDDNPLDEKGQILSIKPGFSCKLSYLANGRVGSAEMHADGTTSQFRMVDGELLMTKRTASVNGKSATIWERSA